MDSAIDNAFAKSAMFMNKLKNKLTSSSSKPNHRDYKPQTGPKAVPSAVKPVRQRDSVAPIFSSRYLLHCSFVLDFRAHAHHQITATVWTASGTP